MNKAFKTLLLKMARLPKADQQWILNQLSAQQREQFKGHEGHSLLKQAQRFYKVPQMELPLITKPVALPGLCQTLRHQTALYIGIILEQGQFEWEHEFLQTTEQQDEIKQVIAEVVGTLKPATKLCVFEHWQSELAFDDQLENVHG